MSATAQLPVNVSPFIKAARWSFLIMGFTYGLTRYNILMKKERKRLDELERTRPEREAKAAEERKIKLQAEMEEFNRIFK